MNHAASTRSERSCKAQPLDKKSARNKSKKNPICWLLCGKREKEEEDEEEGGGKRRKRKKRR